MKAELKLRILMSATKIIGEVDDLMCTIAVEGEVQSKGFEIDEYDMYREKRVMTTLDGIKDNVKKVARTLDMTNEQVDKIAGEKGVSLKDMKMIESLERIAKIVDIEEKYNDK